MTSTNQPIVLVSEPSSLLLSQAVSDPDHDFAFESPMPTMQRRREWRTHRVFLIPLGFLVACIYIGVPLTLFVHDFAHRGSFALAIAAIAIATVFGGVIRGLRSSTCGLGAPTRGIRTTPVASVRNSAWLLNRSANSATTGSVGTSSKAPLSIGDLMASEAQESSVIG